MRLLILVCASLLTTPIFAQGQAAPATSSPYFSLQAGSPGSPYKRIELSSDTDSSWSRWKERGYSFGFNPALTPMYSIVNGMLSTPYMIQVRGNANEKNKKRWGYHLFEGYATDDKSRITMLVNKHIELDKPVAEYIIME